MKRFPANEGVLFFQHGAKVFQAFADAFQRRQVTAFLFDNIPFSSANFLTKTENLFPIYIAHADNRMTSGIKVYLLDMDCETSARITFGVGSDIDTGHERIPCIQLHDDFVAGVPVENIPRIDALHLLKLKGMVV